MDVVQFRAVMRGLLAGASRRDLIRGLSALSVGAGLGALPLAEDAAEAGRHNRKNRKQHRRNKRQQNSAAKSSCPARSQICANRCGNVTKQCGGGKRTYNCTPCHLGGTGRCDVCPKGCAYATMQSAIDATSAGGTIRVCPGDYRQELTIPRDITIIGSGQGQDATKNTHLTGTGSAATLTIPGSTVTLKLLRIKEGVGVVGGGVSGSGGADVTLEACTVSSNSAEGQDALGGGIGMQGGKLTMTDCLVTGNEAAVLGGGIYLSHTTAQLTGTTITENIAISEGGGGIHADFGQLTLTDCHLVSNNADGTSGGGIDLENGTLTLQNTAIAYNIATLQGGGILNNGTIELDNKSIITGNTAPDGAGVHNQQSITCAATNVYSNTTTNCVDNNSGTGCQTCNPV